MFKNLFFVLLITLQSFTEMVAHFPLDGCLNDISGNGHICKVSGAELTTDKSGNQNSAYRFDGIDDNIIGNANTNFELTERTLSVWVMSLSKGNQSIVGYLNKEGHQGYMLGIRGDGTFTCFEDNFNSNDTTGEWEHAYSDKPYAGDEAWHFLVGLRRNDTTYLYVDNKRQTGIAVLSPTFTLNSNIMVGQAKTDILFHNFKGKIDDIRFYDRALSDSELTTLYYSSVSIKNKKSETFNILKYDFKYQLNKNSLVNIKCFNISGKILYSYKEIKSAGTHDIKLPEFPNGMYILSLEAGNIKERKTFHIFK